MDFRGSKSDFDSISKVFKFFLIDYQLVFQYYCEAHGEIHSVDIKLDKNHQILSEFYVRRNFFPFTFIDDGLPCCRSNIFRGKIPQDRIVVWSTSSGVRTLVCERIERAAQSSPHRVEKYKNISIAFNSRM